MNLNEWVLVIPSIREINLEYLKFIPEGLKIFIIDDTDGSIKANRKQMEVFNYAHQKKIMKSNYDLIPHKTAACRNFALYYIWKYTDYKFILSLDDDCMTRGGFMEQYSVLGKSLELETVVKPSWFNTIDLFKLDQKIYARGYPYFERCDQKQKMVKTKAKVALHMGLWDKILDTDAMDKYLFKDYQLERPGASLKKQIIRIGDSKNIVKFPFSAMNFGFIRELSPIMYQFPMWEKFTDRYSLWRFDDIWAGYVIQSLVALKNDAVTIGAPVIQHMKLGNLEKEMLGEHYGHLISPYFYSVIDEAVSHVSKGPYAEMYVELFDHVVSNAKKLQLKYRIPHLYWKYIFDTACKLSRWGKLFTK